MATVSDYTQLKSAADIAAASGFGNGKIIGVVESGSLKLYEVGETDLGSGIQMADGKFANLVSTSDGVDPFEQLTEDGLSLIKIEKGAVYYRRMTLSGPTADTNNFPLGDSGTYFRLTPSGGDWTITGFDSGGDGRMILLNNTSVARSIILAHEDLGSSAENRIVTPSQTNVTILPGHHAQLIYDSPASRWMLINAYQ